MPTPPAAPAEPTLEPAVRQALFAGRDAVRPCLELMDHDADEFAGCVKYRAALDRPPGDGDEALRRLGAYWYGWFMADIHAAFALAGAAEAAQILLAEAVALQKRAGLGDAALCPLIDAPCERIIERKRQLLAPPFGPR